MVNEVDKEATGYLQFPSFLSLMSKKYSDQNAEDEIREAFRVFDGVRSHLSGTFRSARTTKLGILSGRKRVHQSTGVARGHDEPRREAERRRDRVPD